MTSPNERDLQSAAGINEFASEIDGATRAMKASCDALEEVIQKAEATDAKISDATLDSMLDGTEAEVIQAEDELADRLDDALLNLATKTEGSEERGQG